jgi:lipopolysaccharide exporter
MTVFTLGTYLLHSFRPKLSLSQLSNQWQFSQWILYNGCLGYVRAQMDTAIVSTLFPVGQLGKYHLVRDISIMPSIDIIMPAITPLLSAYSKAKSDKFDTARKFELSFIVLNLMIIPLCFFIYYFPEPIIDFLLGSKWNSTYELLQIFSLFLYSIAILQILSQFCIAIGKVKQLFIFDMFSTIVIGSALLYFAVGSIAEFAGLR